MNYETTIVLEKLMGNVLNLNYLHF